MEPHAAGEAADALPVDAADWTHRLETALAAKHAAADDSRRRRRDRQRLIAAAELARRAGGPMLSVPVLTQADRCVLAESQKPRPPGLPLPGRRAALLPLASPLLTVSSVPACRPAAARRQQLARWRRQRAFAVLVAEDRSSGELLGSAAVSMAQVGRRRCCLCWWERRVLSPHASMPRLPR